MLKNLSLSSLQITDPCGKTSSNTLFYNIDFVVMIKDLVSLTSDEALTVSPACKPSY